MVRVRVKPTARLQKSVRRNLKKVLQSRSLLEGIGALVLKATKGFSRQGKEPGSLDSFKALDKDTTVPHRKYLAKHNQTSDVFSPGRSNLSLTGQLLESLRVKISRPKSQIFVQPSGTRRPYKGKNGPIKQSITSNKKLAEILGKDRPFLRVSSLVRKQIENHIRRFLRRSLGNKGIKKQRRS